MAYLRTIYITLFLSCNLLVFVVGASIVFYIHHHLMDDVTLLTDQRMAALTQAKAEKVYSFLEVSHMVARSAQKNTHILADMRHDPHRVIRNFVETLTLFPHIDSVILVSKDGSSLNVTRLLGRRWGTQGTLRQDRSYIMAERHRPAAKGGSFTTQRWFFDTLGHHKNLTPQQEQAVVTPPLRDLRNLPWFVQLLKTGHKVLKTAAVLHNAGAGLTEAYPLRTPGSETMEGGIALEVSASSFAHFLKGLSIDHLKESFLLDEGGRILAHSDLTQALRPSHQGLRPRTLKTLSYPALQKAFRTHQLSGSQRVPLTDTRGSSAAVASFVPVKNLAPAPPLWKNHTLVLLFDKDPFRVHITATQNQILIFVALMWGVAALAVFVISQKVSHPLRQLTASLQRVRQMDFDFTLDTQAYFQEISQMVDIFKGVLSALQSFGKYVPKGLIKQMLSTQTHAALGGEKRLLTILFSDIRGFTSLSEAMDPADMALHLSEYFDEFSHILLTHQATIDKYIGDAVMAFWGAPAPDPSHALHACQAALAAKAQLDQCNDRWARAGKPVFFTRFGISTGDVVVGNIGSFDRLQYTAIGDEVNVASRLEGTNTLYGTQILISESTAKLLKEKFILRPVDIIAVKGRQEGVPVFELMAEISPGNTHVSALIDLSLQTEAAFHAYQERAWEKALVRYQKILHTFPGDSLATVFVQRCSTLIRTPPAADWDGVRRLNSK